MTIRIVYHIIFYIRLFIVLRILLLSLHLYYCSLVIFILCLYYLLVLLVIMYNFFCESLRCGATINAFLFYLTLNVRLVFELDDSASVAMFYVLYEYILSGLFDADLMWYYLLHSAGSSDNLLSGITASSPGGSKVFQPTGGAFKSTHADQG